MKNYSHSKHYASGGKWTRPVIVPAYEESKSNDGIVWVVMIAVIIIIAAAIYFVI